MRFACSRRPLARLPRAQLCESAGASLWLLAVSQRVRWALFGSNRRAGREHEGPPRRETLALREEAATSCSNTFFRAFFIFHTSRSQIDEPENVSSNKQRVSLPARNAARLNRPHIRTDAKKTNKKRGGWAGLSTLTSQIATFQNCPVLVLFSKRETNKQVDFPQQSDYSKHLKAMWLKKLH